MMASLTDLEGRLAGLGLDSPFPDVPAANALTKPIDIYRLHLASLIASTLECDVAAAYEAILTATDLTLADLAVVVPKLKPKDVKDIKEFAAELVQKVSATIIHLICVSVLNCDYDDLIAPFQTIATYLTSVCGSIPRWSSAPLLLLPEDPSSAYAAVHT